MADLDQDRAAFAWQRVELAKRDMPAGKYSDYKNLAKGAPAMIMNNGLMQTLAFFHSKVKGKPQYNLLSNDLLAWLERQCSMPRDYAALMGGLFVLESANYRHATDECMQLLRWLRQFADTEAES